MIFHKISFHPLSILYISPFLQNFTFFQKKVLTFQKTYAILINVVRDNTPKQRNRDVAQFGRAPALGAGSRRFKSCHLDQATSLMVALILTSAPSRVHIYNDHLDNLPNLPGFSYANFGLYGLLYRTAAFTVAFTLTSAPSRVHI